MILVGRCGRSAILPVLTSALLLAAIWQATVGRAYSTGEGLPMKPVLSEPEKKFGIRILSLRPTAYGRMLDLRFQVIDPEKAKPILDKTRKSYLSDQKSGKTLPVPVTKAGTMRQTTLKPEEGRVYFTLFANPNGLVKENSLVTLVIGDFSKSDIVVNGTEANPVTP